LIFSNEINRKQPLARPAIGIFCTLPRPPTARIRAALDTLSAAFLYPGRIGGAASGLGCERPAAGALRFVLFHQRDGESRTAVTRCTVEAVQAVRPTAAG